jgi:hypothetical protein
VVITLTVACWAAGCGTTSTSPDKTTPEKSSDELFKAIVDRKKDEITRFLEAKGSAVMNWTATVKEQTDAQTRPEFPYVGEIAFNYVITKKEKEEMSIVRWGTGHDFTATYRYSKARREWVYEGCGGRGERDGKDLLVRFGEVTEAFEKGAGKRSEK